MGGLIGNHIRAVVFDFDDTLVATIEAKWAAHKHVARKHYGKELKDEDIRPHWGKPMTALFGLLYGESNAEAAMKLEQQYNREFPKVVYEDTLDLLKSLNRSSKLLGLVTALDRANLVRDLAEAGIDENLFDYTQAQEDSKYHKPNPRVFESLKDWLIKNNVAAKQTVYIGDGLQDMKAAIGAGFEFIGVTTGLVTQKEFESYNVPSASRLRDLLGV